jgi:predicted MPP superfamily phosphohydrolase
MWIGVMSISFSVMVLKLPLDFLLPGRKKELTAGAFILIAAIVGYSLYNGSRPPVVKELRIEMQNLPSELSGFTVIQLSDLQISRLDDVEWLESLVETVNEQKADLIVITGDILDEPVGNLSIFTAAFKKLSATHGVIAVPGNHEHYAGMENFKKFARQTGITTLINESTTIAGVIKVIGLDDYTGRSYRNPGEVMKPLLAGGGKEIPVIFLIHRPYFFEQAADMGVDLQLSGHTHCGQIPPFDLIVKLMFKYSHGLYKYKSSYIYTTCGSGTWGPPMRFLSRSEIVKFVLESR